MFKRLALSAVVIGLLSVSAWAENFIPSGEPFAIWNCGKNENDPKGPPTDAVIAKFYYGDPDPVFPINTLVLSGNGEMADYIKNREDIIPDAQWKDYIINQLVIEEGITTIGERAFAGLTSLVHDVTIPNSVTSIGAQAFDGSSLGQVVISNNATVIGDEAFRGTNLVSVTIPNSVTKIGNRAFADCIKLETAVIGNSMETIGEEAFRSTKFASITIPNSVKDIGAYAFMNNNRLESIVIPDNVLTLGAGAFANCSGLKSAAISKYVWAIDASMFENCAELASVTYSDSVRWIATKAFAGCKSLSAITIPAAVQYISDSAFFGCRMLDSVIILRSSPPSLFGDNVFGELPSDVRVYVPNESLAAYQANSGWSRYFQNFTGVSQQASVSYRAKNSSTAAASRISVNNRKLTIRTPAQSTANIRLIDIRGKSVAKFVTRDNGTASFSLAKVPAGLYFVEVRDGIRLERLSVVLK